MTCPTRSLPAAVVLALALSTSLGSTPAWAGPSGAERADADGVEKVPVRVVTDLGALDLPPEREELMRDVVVFQVTEAFRGSHGVEVVEQGEDAALLRIAVTSIDLESLHYEVTLEIQRGTKRTTFDPFECKECTEHGIARAVVSRLGKVVPYLAVAEEEPQETGPTEGPTGPEVEEPGPEAPGPEGPEETDKPRAPLGVVGKVGIGVLATGAAGLIAGGVVFAQGRKLDDPSGNLEEAGQVDYHPPGIATMAVGGALLVTGVTLLVVDRVRARKPGGQEKTTRLSPTVGGVVLVHRF